MMAYKKAYAFHLRLCVSTYAAKHLFCLCRSQFFLVLARTIAVFFLTGMDAYVVEDSGCFEDEESFIVDLFQSGNGGSEVVHLEKMLNARHVSPIVFHHGAN